MTASKIPAGVIVEPGGGCQAAVGPAMDKPTTHAQVKKTRQASLGLTGSL